MTVKISMNEINLSGKVLFMAISEDDGKQYNPQSCDCSEVVIVMDDRILLAEHNEHGEEGAISIRTISDFDKQKYEKKIVPSNSENFVFVKSKYSADGFLTDIEYRFDDRYVFIFSSEYNLIVTMSVSDLMDENAITPIEDNSVLFGAFDPKDWIFRSLLGRKD